MKDLIKREKKYEGQALAITMVVLVISALLGLSIYSRTRRDRALTFEERASAEALEVSDSILEQLTTQSVGDVREAIQQYLEGQEINWEEGIVLSEVGEEDDDITGLFRLLEIIEGDSTIGGLLYPICPLPEDSMNKYELTVKLADEDTAFEVKPGETWSLPIGRGMNVEEEECNILNIKADYSGDSRAGFVVMKIYCDYDENGVPTSCDKYEIDTEEGFEKYCFSNDALTCNAELDTTTVPHLRGYWEPTGAGDVIGINIAGDNSPSEIRVVPVGGTIELSYSFDNSICLDGLSMYHFKVTANCSGVYRGKEILIPEQKWYHSIFDYVIFNSQGSI